MSGVEIVKVKSEDDGIRLNRWFLKYYPGLSLGRLQKLLRTKQVKVDGSRAETNLRLVAGQEIRVPPLDNEKCEMRPKGLSDDDKKYILDMVIYKDDDIIVLNKPSGLAVQGGTNTKRHVDGFLEALKFGLEEKPKLVHRIDKDTSGILVVAKNDFTHTRLSEQFAEHTIDRIYQAFVWGYVQKTSGLVIGDIGRSPHNRQKMAIVANGKKAVTHYERMAVFGGGIASHIQCILETGRTHQIRVHMSSIGHSLIGDPIYGTIPKMAPDFAKYFPRQALHAGFLGFTHPRTGERLSFEAPLPEDMQELLNQLSNL